MLYLDHIGDPHRDQPVKQSEVLLQHKCTMLVAVRFSMHTVLGQELLFTFNMLFDAVLPELQV